jgi:hypothetical protein
MWRMSSLNRRSAASAFARASGDSLPVWSSPLPSPASSFSLKIGAGMRCDPA